MGSGSNRAFFKFYYLTSLPSETGHLSWLRLGAWQPLKPPESESPGPVTSKWTDSHAAALEHLLN